MPDKYLLCKKGHKNSPNAKQCWVCADIFTPPKIVTPTVTAPHCSYLPSAPQVEVVSKDTYAGYPTAEKPKIVDVSAGDEECKRRYNRERCDEKDPSGQMCVFVAMGCGIRDRRFKVSRGN